MSSEEWELDELDREILSILQDNARIAFTEIARQLESPDTTIHFRVRRMQEKGIIKSYTVLISPKSLGLTQHALFKLTIGGHIIAEMSKERTHHIAKKLKENPAIRFVGIEEDNTTIFCLALVHDMKELEELRASFERNTDVTQIEMRPLEKVLKGEDYTTQLT